MKRSFDGGLTFEPKALAIADVTDDGIFDGVRSISFDGIAGARTSFIPSLDIANGTPTGVGAPDTLALGSSDGSGGLNHEPALVQLADDQGATWSGPTAVEQSGDRPDFAFLDLAGRRRTSTSSTTGSRTRSATTPPPRGSSRAAQAR